MAASLKDLEGWFDRGVEQGATHMVVICDRYDWEDYPVYVNEHQDVEEVIDLNDNSGMNKVMEVYKMSDDKAEQMAERRAWRIL